MVDYTNWRIRDKSFSDINSLFRGFKMKKIISFLAMMCLKALSVSALVIYTGTPSLPYTIYGHVDWQSQALGGARVELTNQNTGYVTITNTNEDGYWQEEATNWLTISKSRPPVMFGDIIKIKSLDGCGTNDVCEKTFTAKDGIFEDFASVDLSVSGVLVVTVTTPAPSSSSSSGSSSSGGGGGGSVPAWICESWSDCAGGVQTRICRQGQFTRKEKQECAISEPKPVVVIPKPVIAPVIPKPTEVTIEPYVCSDGSKVSVKENCPIESKEHEEIVVNKILTLKSAGIISVSLAALIIGLYLCRRSKKKFATAEKGAK